MIILVTIVVIILPPVKVKAKATPATAGSGSTQSRTNQCAHYIALFFLHALDLNTEAVYDTGKGLSGPFMID